MMVVVQEEERGIELGGVDSNRSKILCPYPPVLYSALSMTCMWEVNTQYLYFHVHVYAH